MRIEDVFARVIRQAEERRADDERRLAEERRLKWQRALVLRLMVHRFGAISQETIARVEDAHVEMLDGLVDRVMTAKTEEEVFGIGEQMR
jgi:hypothetical protein